VAVANVQLSDTFNTWRIRTNSGFTQLNLLANTTGVARVTANLAVITHTATLSGNVTMSGVNTSITSGSLHVTANTRLYGANTDIRGGTLLVTSNTVFSGANVNIKAGTLQVTANTRHLGTLYIAGLSTTSNSVAGAITEVAGDSIAFAIALG